MIPTTLRTQEHEAVSEPLRDQWAKHDLIPLWESPNGAIQPPAERSAIWKWADMRPILMETVKIGLPSIVERRVLQLVNRSMPAGADATAGLMNATLQGLMPGEFARPHRHSMNALRFVLEGAGAVTTVNGEPCVMETGDLITTPGRTWHEHRHTGDGPTFWLDVLDVYLHRVLGTAVFQPGPVFEAARSYRNESFATPNIVPVLDDDATALDSPVFRYPWSNTLRALENAPIREDGSRLVRYVNPISGGSCMSLIDCHALQLDAARPTAGRHAASSAIVSVVEGHGWSQIGDIRVDWSAKDTFTVPYGADVTHVATDGQAILFTADNGEVYRRLGITQ
jgi:gentisate 1,2-dioxygenase